MLHLNDGSLGSLHATHTMHQCENKTTYNIIDPFNSLEVGEVDPAGKVFSTKQTMQVLVAHILNDLGVALILYVPPSLPKLFPPYL